MTFDPGAVGVYLRWLAGLSVGPPPGFLRSEPRLAPGYCIGYRDGVVTWTGALTRIGEAPALDELWLNPADIATVLAATTRAVP